MLEASGGGLLEDQHLSHIENHEKRSRQARQTEAVQLSVKVPDSTFHNRQVVEKVSAQSSRARAREHCPFRNVMSSPEQVFIRLQNLAP